MVTYGRKTYLLIQLGHLDNIKKNIIEALRECYGIVKDACRKANVPRSTYYNWLNSDEEFKAAVEDTQEDAIDFVEGKLFEKINGIQLGKISDGCVVTYEQPPSDTAIIFYLKTKGKKRGYIERNETDLSVSGNLGVTINETKTYEKK